MALFSKERVQPPTAPSEARAYLNKGSKIMGKLFFEGPVRIDGQVDGEICANDEVFIGDTAVVTAHIKGGSVVVTGRVTADIIAAKRLEIRRTAKVFGNLTTPVLVIEDGALFEGHCTMSSQVQDHKVTPMVAKQEPFPVPPAVAGSKLR
jgi:cytoskeletal protein CcmA (bactofilin family)